MNYVKQDGRKGILITIGDDNVHPELTASEIQAWLEPTYDGKNVSNEVLLAAVKSQYEVYHIVVTDGSSYTYDCLTKKNKSEKQQAEDAEKWARLLGKNNIFYARSNTVADAIATIVIRHRPHQKEGMANLPEQEWGKKNKENLTDEQWVEVLSYTLCPLTRHYMQDPTTLGDGKRAFEKQAIEDYLRTQKTDPLTGNKLTASELILKPNINIAQLCVDYESFFDVLPPDRKERLIHLTLQEILPAQPKVIEARGVYPHPVFASKGSEVSGKAPEKSQSVESKALDKMMGGLICPITLDIMVDPVILVETGQSYSKAALVRWLAQNDTDPISNNKLTDKTIRDNHVLKSLRDAARAAKSAQAGMPKP